MSTVCPCGSGRLLPLSPAQIRAITSDRARSETDLARAHRCTVFTIRHLRSLPCNLVEALPSA